MRTHTAVIALIGLVIIGSGCLDFGDSAEPGAEINETEEPSGEQPNVEVEEVLQSLEEPWSLEAVPGEDKILITEKPGNIVLADTSERSIERLNNAVDVDDTGQGGLLDIELHPDYSENNLVYMTYTDVNSEGESATHLGRAELNVEDEVIENFENLHIARPFIASNIHFGSRIVFDDENNVYFTTGDRGSKDFGPQHFSQDTSNELGSTLRLTDSGEIPGDNPFIGDDEVVDSIYSFGHRNSQGMTVEPGTGEIWQSEHGEEDGDEINILESGGNYGWPITHTGCEYGTDRPVAENPQDNPEVVNPVYYWECGTGGFPPSGMAFYSGDGDWDGDLFIGNLAGQHLGRFNVDRNGDTVEVTENEPLLDGEGWRIRDVEQINDSLFVITDSGILARIDL